MQRPLLAGPSPHSVPSTSSRPLRSTRQLSRSSAPASRPRTTPSTLQPTACPVLSNLPSQMPWRGRRPHAIAIATRVRQRRGVLGCPLSPHPRLATASQRPRSCHWPAASNSSDRTLSRTAPVSPAVYGSRRPVAPVSRSLSELTLPPVQHRDRRHVRVYESDGASSSDGITVTVSTPRTSNLVDPASRHHNNNTNSSSLPCTVYGTPHRAGALWMDHGSHARCTAWDTRFASASSDDAL
ncbi:hypothetical protein C8Q78DRAFT_425773 [Trametes maxima]|nr:hypothetical protein C8Q78DRAFT_425773 [Trametes maxima]